jgi:hypothetical protein
VIVTFTIKNINPGSKGTKRTIAHRSPTDSIVIFSKFNPQLFLDVSLSPAVFSVGSSPFLSVSSIVEVPPVRMVRKLVSSFTAWLTGPPDEEEIPKARFDWELPDEPRVARSAVVSEDGRWLAVPDQQGRVSIIDCVFGHFTRILKGMRDAQVAWSHSNCLLVFAPARGLIVACTVPMGEIFDAVKVDRRGKLFQCVKAGNELQAVFMDGKGNFGEISVEPPGSKSAD